MEYKYIMILCEGETEDLFVRNILSPYLQMKNVYTDTVILGGVSRYAGIKKDLEKLGKSRKYDLLTTMLDYYKLPQDVPGVKTCKEVEPCRIAEHIEKSIHEDLKEKMLAGQFLPYIQMHEFESLLFSDVDCFEKCNGIKPKMIAELKSEVGEFETPEHVNNSEQTAPSKRIKRIFGSYQKTIDGISVAQAIGIETMMKRCSHFARWIENLVAETT
ncbi:MAG: DUF4276 family protein [Lachnospiraceae bacterium]|nr:DUF4276 family protein [Lachnospiraceae bacterium]